MTMFSQSHELRESHSSSLGGLELDDTQEQMLLSITRKHCKLALEHSQASTTRERRPNGIPLSISSLSIRRSTGFATGSGSRSTMESWRSLPDCRRVT